MPNCQVFPPSYIEQVGCDIEPGRVVAVAFIDEDVTFADSAALANAANWVGLDYASDIIVFKEVRGSYAKAAATEIAGKGKQDTRVVGRKHELNFRVSSVKNNDNFWNTMNRSTNYTIAWVVGSNYDLLMYVDKNVSIDAAPVIEEGIDSEIEWDVLVKWSDIDVPVTADVPTGIFT